MLLLSALESLIPRGQKATQIQIQMHMRTNSEMVLMETMVMFLSRVAESSTHSLPLCGLQYCPERIDKHTCNDNTMCSSNVQQMFGLWPSRHIAISMLERWVVVV